MLRDGRSWLFPLVIGAWITLFGVTYGFQSRVDAGSAPLYFGIASAILGGLFWLMAYVSHSWPPAVPPTKWADFLAIAVPGVSLALSVFFNSKSLWWLVAIAIVILLALGIARRWGAVWGARLLMAAGTLYFAYLLRIVPIDPSAADMLPLISAAADDLMRGNNPYGRIYADASSFKFAYLPIIWLPYAPLVWLGLDPRFLNLAILVGLVALAENIVKRPEGKWALAVGYYPLLLSPVVAQMAIAGHVWPFWLLVAWLAVALINWKLTWAAILVGLLLAARQWSGILALAVATFMVTRSGAKDLLRYAMIALAVWLAIVGPFAATTSDFLGVTYLQLFTQADGYAASGKITNQIALSNLVALLGWASALKYIAATALLLLVGFVYRRPRMTVEEFLFLAGLGYALVLSLVPQLHRYFYMPGFILMALAYARGCEGRARPVATNLS